MKINYYIKRKNDKRTLKVEITQMLIDDLKSVCGIDAEAELENVVNAEIVAELANEYCKKNNIDIHYQSLNYKTIISVMRYLVETSYINVEKEIEEDD